MSKNTIITIISGGGLLKNRNIKGFRGFTLAEVLIALVIIGVIAAMTIPTLINKTNNQEYVSRLKKAYSTLAQATNKIIAEEGKPRGDIGGWASSSENIFNLYKKHLSNAKVCGQDTGCFPQRLVRQLNGYLEPDNSSNDRDNNLFHNLVFADGMQMAIRYTWVWPSCNHTNYGTSNACAYLQIDINGSKGPNMVGRDLYFFAINEYGLVPAGCESTAKPCMVTNDLSNAGWTCACKVLREGAMNY